MRIVFNCRSFLKKQKAGIGRYAFNLVRSLSELDEENEYHLYVPKGIFDLRKRTPRFSGRNFIVKRDWFRRGVASSLGGADLYHAPSPEILPEFSGKIIVTVHDLIYRRYPQGHTPETRAATDRQMASLVERADRMICCSHHTAKDLQELFHVPEERIRVIHQGVDRSVFYPLDEKERDLARSCLNRKGLKEPFFLFVGTLEPRKNLKNVLKAFAGLKRGEKFSGKLVVAGMKGWLQEDLKEEVKGSGLRLEDVVFSGYVTDTDLRYLYNLAAALVFPSFYEGFGFPILEAFCCGTPVVTSQTASCPEIAGDAALLVSPDDVSSIREAMARVGEDKGCAAELIRKGFRQAEEFSFTRTAQQTLGVYEECLGKGRSS